MVVWEGDHTADVEETHAIATSRPYGVPSRHFPALPSPTRPNYARRRPMSTETKRTPQRLATRSEKRRMSAGGGTDGASHGGRERKQERRKENQRGELN